MDQNSRDREAKNKDIAVESREPKKVPQASVSRQFPPAFLGSQFVTDAPATTLTGHHAWRMRDESPMWDFDD